MTIQEKIELLAAKFPQLIILGEYNHETRKIEVICSVCGYKFDLKIDTVVSIRKNACYNCLQAGRRMDESEFVERLKSINSNIEIMSRYIGYSKSIQCKCCVDGHIWRTTPNVLLNGSGCPKCGKKTGLNRKDMMKIIQDKGFEIDVLLDKHMSRSKYATFMCRNCECGYVWRDRFINIEKRKYGCPKCHRKMLDRQLEDKYIGKNFDIVSTDDYIRLLKNIGSDLIPIEEYSAMGMSIKHLCMMHNEITKCSPVDAILGSGCALCKESKGEKAIRRFLDSNNIEYKSQYKFDECKRIKPLMFDFYIPSINCVVEYQGVQHYKEIPYWHNGNTSQYHTFSESNIRDDIKQTFCKNNGIALVVIPHWEYINIEKILNVEVKRRYDYWKGGEKQWKA